jgi:hypothetical protein
MRIARTVATVAALIFASYLVTGVVVRSNTAADTDGSNRPTPSYRLHFGEAPVGRYCPSQFGRAIEPELLVDPC